MKQTLFILFLIVLTLPGWAEFPTYKLSGTITTYFKDKIVKIPYTADWKPFINDRNGPAIVEIKNPFAKNTDAYKKDEETLIFSIKSISFSSKDLSINKINKLDFSPNGLPYIYCKNDESYWAEQHYGLTLDDDICLNLKSINLISFLPIDNTGKINIIIEDKNSGQRWTDQYYIYEKNNASSSYGKNIVKVFEREVPVMIDSFTHINLSKNLIMPFYSAGATLNGAEAYYLNQNNNKFELIGKASQDGEWTLDIPISNEIKSKLNSESFVVTDNLIEKYKPILNEQGEDIGKFDYKSWTDEIICEKAWYNDKWTDDNDLKKFVKEAKDRNLDCNKLVF